jgi:hypothetical protein
MLGRISGDSILLHPIGSFLQGLIMFSELFSENSTVSCMRVMSVSSLAIGGLIALVAVCMNKDLAGASPLVGVFVGAAFGGKVAQKFAEIKGEKDAAAK